MSLTQELNNEDTLTAETAVSDSVTALVGEGKKYRTVEDLAKAYINADMHINELRDDLEERKRNEKMLEDILTEIRAQPNTNADAQEHNSTAQSSNMTPEQVANITKATLKQQTDQQRADANVQRSLQMLDQHYGSRAATMEAFKAVATDTETKKILDSTASTNPELLFRMMTNGQAAPAPVSNSPGVTRTASGVRPATSVALPWSEAQRLRKSDNPKDRAAYNTVEYRARIESAAAEAAAKGIDYFAT